MKTVERAFVALLVVLVSGCSASMRTSSSGAQLAGPSAAWSESSRMAYEATVAAYGPPDELTATMAVWHGNGPWKRTIISATPTQHRFPGPHEDVMEQVVDYRVPPDMFDELARYDGSVIVERTKGEMSARCDVEGANFLALNLAHQIVTGEQTVDGARAEYARQIMAMKAGRPAPLTERLMFAPMPGAADPDTPVAGM